ncbi:hypothetical protein RUND412_004645 [Rhizina undulata]
MVTWNDTLASYAGAHSKKCVFKHSGGPYGENLAAGYPSAATSAEAWGDEGRMYSYAGDGTGFTEATGHFTQMVWEGTKQIGCAAVLCPNMLAQNIDSWYVCYLRVLSTRKYHWRVQVQCATTEESDHHLELEQLDQPLEQLDPPLEQLDHALEAQVETSAEDCP